MKARHQIAIGMFVFLPSIAFAQTLACQFTDSAGLLWRNGAWQVSKFKVGAPFFLKIESGNVTPKSAAKVMVNNPDGVFCHASRGNRVFCSTGVIPDQYALGTSLIFDTKTMKGAISEILGGILQSQDYRDSLSVSAFTCQQMSD
jgi:hypothetical protein